MKKSNVPDNLPSPEVLKLTEKLARDPKSKLFMPLAKEYIKCGMLDEAAMVLQDGLKVHPYFSSAKATLGDLCLEKGQVQEAKFQFEEVIAASPDNLFAHRKLARIYKDEGQMERAKTSCQAVLAVNPKDPEMRGLTDELDRLTEKPAEPEPVAPSDLQESSEGAVEAGAEVPVTDELDRLTEKPAEPEPVAPSDLQESLEGVVEAGAEVPVQEPATIGSGGESAEEDSPAAEEAMEASQETSLPVEESIPAAPTGELQEIETEALADLYIKQGYYEKGKEIYQKLLTREPSNAGLERKLEETEVLLNLLSKSQKTKADSAQEPVAATPEQVQPISTGTAAKGAEERLEAEKIRRLEAWLESIRKGREE